ncbi:MAG TPA: DUF748 domain-containing protein [Syntrophorhabdaceae bacterium]|jgi:hypothetical protein
MEKEQLSAPGEKSSLRMKWWMWVIIGAGGLILVAAIVSQVSIKSLSRHIEHQMNSRLKGYTVRVGRVYFKPLPLSVGLSNVALVQNANPDPPMADVKWIYGSIHWRALLAGHLVGDILIDTPKLHLNLAHIREEEKSKVPLRQKGWQESIQAVLPIRINIITIRNGEVTYIDEGPAKPLQVREIFLKASNIRNISVPDKTYPSGIKMEARVFEKGALKLDGRANFLQEPYPGVKATVELAGIELADLTPVLKKANILIKKGTLSGKGAVEYAPDITEINLESVELKGPAIDYVTLPQTTEAEKERARAAARKAKEASTESSAKIRVGLLTISQGAFGFVNKSESPPFRLFIDNTNATMKNFSNRFAEGPSNLDLTGKFMGTGSTRITGTFRPEKKSPDFNVNVVIENTEMPAMSDLFRAYGDFDIKSGLFSFYSEVGVKDNMVKGYVKPLFKEMKIENRQEKGVIHKAYVGAVKGLSKLLRNEPRKEIATQTDISGPLEGPRPDTWQALVNLVRNAFIKAILPGFQREVGRPSSS